MELAGTFFGQEHLAPARADFEALRSLLKRHRPAVAVRLVLGQCRDWHIPPFRTGLIYPAGQSDAIWQYLQDHGFVGGQTVCSGRGAVTEFFELAAILDNMEFA